jgi:hypothetical protein
MPFSGSLLETPTHHALPLPAGTVTPSLGSCARVSARALIRSSGPKVFCRSPKASIRASLAFARASERAAPSVEDRTVTVESVSSPTATIASNTRSDTVTISAKPLTLTPLVNRFFFALIRN